MENQATQYFELATPRNSKKVHDIEAEYEEALNNKLLKTCIRCKKSKHLYEFGTNYYNGKPMKSCEKCREYLRYYNALRNYQG
jgi:hypothetical protein